MNADHTLDVSAIRQVAEAVGDRPREWRWSGQYPQQITSQGNVVIIAECYESPDHPSRHAEYIAMMDPPTTLALLDALDAARAEVERLRIGLDGAHGNADRMRKSLLDERDAIAEKIAVAIEAEMRRHDGAQIGFSGKGDTYAHAARIAREVGKA